MRSARWIVLAVAAALLCVPPAAAAPGGGPTGVVFYHEEGDPPPSADYRETVTDLMFDPGPSPAGYTIQDYFRTQTFGAVNFTGDEGDVFGPYEVAVASPGTCPFNTWNNEAATKAAVDGFTRSDYNQVVYVYENEPFEANPCEAAGIGGGEVAWINGLNSYTIAHELGHTLGSPHAAAFRCFAPDGVTRVEYSADCDEVFPPGEEASEYGDPFDPMGVGDGISPQTGGRVPLEMTAWRKLEFGAIPAADAPTIAFSGTYTIAPLEQSGGVRMLRIPNGAGEFFDLDFRQPIGRYDSSYAADDPAVNGVAIHLEDESFDPNQPSRLLDMNPATPTFDDAPLAPGRQFRDFRTGVTIETLSAGPSGATVRIGGLPEQIKVKITPAEPRCTVPKLKRRKLGAAKRTVRRGECELGKVRRRHSKKVPKGKVLSQQPRPGMDVPGGSKVALTVSSGPKR